MVSVLANKIIFFLLISKSKHKTTRDRQSQDSEGCLGFFVQGALCVKWNLLQPKEPFSHSTDERSSLISVPYSNYSSPGIEQSVAQNSHSKSPNWKQWRVDSVAFGRLRLIEGPVQRKREITAFCVILDLAIQPWRFPILALTWRVKGNASNREVRNEGLGDGSSQIHPND